MAIEDRSPEPIRLLICDDYFLIREGIKAVIRRTPDMVVVGEAESAEEALHLAEELLPDVVIMDVLLPGMDGMEATSRLRGSNPSVAVVVLTRYDDTEHIMRIYRSGASAYLAKGVGPDDLLNTIRTVSSGGVVVHPHVADAIFQSFTRRPEVPTPPPAAGLSPREQEVLRLVARGYSNKEIARELGTSLRTAQNHMANIFHKLELNDRVSAAVYAVRQGLAAVEELSPDIRPGLRERDLLLRVVGAGLS